MKPKFRIIQTTDSMWLEKLEGEDHAPLHLCGIPPDAARAPR